MRRVNWRAPQVVASLENLQLRYVLGDVTPLVPEPSFSVGDRRIPPPPPILYPTLPPLNDGVRPVSSAPDGSSRSTASPSDAAPYRPVSDARPTASSRSYAAENRPEGEELPPLQVVHRKVVVSVLIAATSRSVAPNLEGSTKRAGDHAGYLRFTLSSQVTARNVIARLAARGQSDYN